MACNSGLRIVVAQTSGFPYKLVCFSVSKPGRRSIMNKDTGITCKNLPFWSKSIQVQRLQSEMEAVEDSRTLKRTSEVNAI